MTNCPICSSDSITTTYADVDGREFGLPSGVLKNVPTTTCAECGESFQSIPAQGAILALFRRALVKLARPLTGDEFAFLRRTLGVTGRGYADAIGTTNVTISRVENALAAPALQDGLIRAITLLDIEGLNPISEMSERVDEQVSVDVGGVSRGRRLDITTGWETFMEQPAYYGKVVPIRPKQTAAIGPEFSDEFEAVNESYDLASHGATACR